MGSLIPTSEFDEAINQITKKEINAVEEIDPDHVIKGVATRLIDLDTANRLFQASEAVILDPAWWYPQLIDAHNESLITYGLSSGMCFGGPGLKDLC